MIQRAYTEKSLYLPTPLFVIRLSSNEFSTRDWERDSRMRTETTLQVLAYQLL